jgi:hypothetical protein
MSVKEKARDLVDKYDNTLTYLESKSKAKQCALIAVDEVIKSQKNIFGLNNKVTKFYLEVKQEIENL